MFLFKETSIMLNFTTRQNFLVPSFELDLEEREKLDKFLLLLEKTGVSKFLSENKKLNGGRPNYSRYNLFATILYGFAFGSPTLRDLETSCKYDLRYFYLMEQERPKHSTFGTFINEIILPNRQEIFKECKIAIEDVFIDGSKFEADANKYKFVWKPTKFHEKLSDKIRALLCELKMDRSVPKTGIIESKLIAEKLTELSIKLTNDETLIKNSINYLSI